METAPANGSHGGGVGKPRGAEKGSGGRGGRGGATRGAAAGAGARRGRGGGGEGGPFRGGARGKSHGRGGQRGKPAGRGKSASLRGASRGRGKAATKSASKVRKVKYEKVNESFPPTGLFLEPVMVPLSDDELKNSFVVTNLPALAVYDNQQFCSFIAEFTGPLVQDVFFKKSPSDSSLVAAIGMCKTTKAALKCLEKLHGQMYQDHHLLVEKYSPENLKFYSAYCIKVKNLSTKVTEERLWKLFESCGKLGMIYLNPAKSEGTLEAIINFEEPDAVIEALKLDGTKIKKANINVVQLKHKATFRIHKKHDLETILKDFNVAHIEYRRKITGKLALVYFDDEESCSKAVGLNGKAFDNFKISARPATIDVYLHHQNLSFDDITAVFGPSMAIKPYARKCGVAVLKFKTKAEADAALKASPVLIKNKSHHIYDCVSKVPATLPDCEDAKENEEDDSVEESEEGDNARNGDNGEGEEEQDDEEESDSDMEVGGGGEVPRSSQKQVPSDTELKRKQNGHDSKEKKKKRKHN